MRATVFVFVALAPVHECAYTCGATGTECTSANRNYSAGAYQVLGTLESACTANALCYQYEWDETGGVGFQCSSTATRVDIYDEFSVCVKQGAGGTRAAATFSDGTALKAAVNEWRANASAAEEQHGHITYWVTSLVADMDSLFKVRCAASSAPQRPPPTPLPHSCMAGRVRIQPVARVGHLKGDQHGSDVLCAPHHIAPGSTPPHDHHPHHAGASSRASPPGHASSGRKQRHSTSRSRGTPRG